MQNKPLKLASNVPYLVAIVVMFLIGLGTVALISKLRPDVDILLVMGGVSAFIVPTTASLLALMKAQETHLSVNSRLDEFIKNAGLVARAEGVAEGRKQVNK